MEVCRNKIKTSRRNSSIIINKAIINKQVLSHTIKETKKIKAKSRVKSERQKTEKMNDERKDDDKGWKFQKKKKGNKSIKYTVRDFLRLEEKEIKAERIEEEEKRREETRSEISSGAKTGVSDLVPALNIRGEKEHGEANLGAQAESGSTLGARKRTEQGNGEEGRGEEDGDEEEGEEEEDGEEEGEGELSLIHI